jgi:hypothetical protein
MSLYLPNRQHIVPDNRKDGFKYPGVDSTIGYVSLIGKSKATVASPLVKLLLDLGAVLYVKTNIPQTLMVPILVSFWIVNILTNVSLRLRIRTITSLGGL